MTLESKPEKLNNITEQFQTEFNTSLLKYFLAADVLNNHIYLEDEEAFSNDEIERFKNNEKEGMTEMVLFTISILKVVNDRKKIIDDVSNAFSKMNTRTNRQYDSPQFSKTDAKLQFFEKLTLELSKNIPR